MAEDADDGQVSEAVDVPSTATVGDEVLRSIARSLITAPLRTARVRLSSRKVGSTGRPRWRCPWRPSAGHTLGAGGRSVRGPALARSSLTSEREGRPRPPITPWLVGDPPCATRRRIRLPERGSRGIPLALRQSRPSTQPRDWPDGANIRMMETRRKGRLMAMDAGPWGESMPRSLIRVLESGLLSGSETKLKILIVLKSRRMTGAEIARALDMGRGVIHRHLQRLDDDGYVSREESSRKWVYYSLTDRGRDLLT